MEITIKKVRLGKSGLSLEYVTQSPLEDNPEEMLTATIKEKRDQKPHNELRLPFADLRPHLVILTEMNVENDLEKIRENQMLDDFEVRGMTLGGEDENAGFTIVGLRHLKNKKVFNMNTPFMKFTEQYDYMGDLREIIDECIKETIAYIKGKKAPSNQFEIEFKEDNDE